MIQRDTSFTSSQQPGVQGISSNQQVNIEELPIFQLSDMDQIIKSIEGLTKIQALIRGVLVRKQMNVLPVSPIMKRIQLKGPATNDSKAKHLSFQDSHSNLLALQQQTNGEGRLIAAKKGNKAKNMNGDLSMYDLQLGTTQVTSKAKGLAAGGESMQDWRKFFQEDELE